MGLDSKALEGFVRALGSALGEPVPISAIFDAPTPASLASHIAGGEVAPPAPSVQLGSGLARREGTLLTARSHRLPAASAEAPLALVPRNASTSVPLERWDVHAES